MLIKMESIYYILTFRQCFSFISSHSITHSFLDGHGVILDISGNFTKNNPIFTDISIIIAKTRMIIIGMVYLFSLLTV